MYCAACGSALPDQARFCGGCGAPQARARAAGPAGDGPGPAAASLWTSPGAHPATAPFDTRLVSSTIGSLVRELAELPVRTLVPWRVWLDERVWQQSWAALFLVAAAAPFLLLHLGVGSGDFRTVSWGFSLYFAFLWFIALHTLIRPGPVAWQLLGKVVLFTNLAGVSIAVGLERHLLNGDMNVLKFVPGVGLPEEFAKALAVYVFLYRSAHSLRSFLFVGAVSGLAFGAAEAAAYSTVYANMLPYADPAQRLILMEVWRLVSDSLFHACIAGVTAYFIGLASHHRSHAVGLIGFGLAFAAVLHGLYDNFASGWLGTALAVVIILVFVGYVQTAERIGQRFAEQAGSPTRPGPPTTPATPGYFASAPAPGDPPVTTLTGRGRRGAGCDKSRRVGSAGRYARQGTRRRRTAVGRGAA